MKTKGLSVTLENGNIMTFPMADGDYFDAKELTIKTCYEHIKTRFVITDKGVITFQEV